MVILNYWSTTIDWERLDVYKWHHKPSKLLDAFLVSGRDDLWYFCIHNSSKPEWQIMFCISSKNIDVVREHNSKVKVLWRNLKEEASIVEGNRLISFLLLYLVLNLCVHYDFRLSFLLLFEWVPVSSLPHLFQIKVHALLKIKNVTINVCCVFGYIDERIYPDLEASLSECFLYFSRNSVYHSIMRV